MSVLSKQVGLMDLMIYLWITGKELGPNIPMLHPATQRAELMEHGASQTIVLPIHST